MAGVFFRANGWISPVSFMEFACDPHTLRLRRPQAEPVPRLHLEEAEPSSPQAPPEDPPEVAIRRVPRSRAWLIGGLIGAGAALASVAGFLWGRSELTFSKARLALSQLASGRRQEGEPVAESLRLRETIRQIQRDLDTQLTENAAMKSRIRELDEKLVRLSGARRAPIEAVKPDSAETAPSRSQPLGVSQGADAPVSAGPAAAPDAAAAARPLAPAGTGSPAVAGPRSGKLLWTGYLAPGATMTIEGRRASAGSLNGALPQAPLSVSVYPAELSSGGLEVYSPQPRHAAGNAGERQSAETSWLPIRYRYDVERARGITVIEAPVAANGYKLALKGGDKPVSVAVITWRAVQ
jgi:hypothetical protein